MGKLRKRLKKIFAYQFKHSLIELFLLTTTFGAIGVFAGYWIGLDAGYSVCAEDVHKAKESIELMVNIMSKLLKNLYAFSI